MKVGSLTPLSLPLSLYLFLSLSPLSPSLPPSPPSLPPSLVDDEDEVSSPQHTSLADTDSFDEVYKPFELTDFDSLLAKNIGRPIE